MSPEALQSAGITALVTTILYTLAGKFLLPKFFTDLERFQRETLSELKALTVQIQATKDDAHTEIEMLGNRWHERMDRLNATVGGLSVKTDRNEKDIDGLAREQREAGEMLARLEGTMTGLQTAVQALTAAINRGRSDGRARDE